MMNCEVKQFLFHNVSILRNWTANRKLFLIEIFNIIRYKTIKKKVMFYIKVILCETFRVIFIDKNVNIHRKCL